MAWYAGSSTGDRRNLYICVLVVPADDGAVAVDVSTNLVVMYLL
jgi:hypothetical protein